MAKNSNLNQAKIQKKDEFFTLYSSIEKELIHYEDQLKDKIIYCNCDDVEHSNFIEYFCRQGPYIGIKKLYGTCYKADNTSSYYITFEPPENLEDYNADDWKNYLIKTQMNGNGDFRSEESIPLLEESDVIISNPPFSIIREYIAQLVKYNKKFLFIGTLNTLKYKDVFPLIKNNKMWAGYSFNETMEFIMPNDYELKGKAYIDEHGKKHGFVPGICWYTNLEVSKRNEPLQLVFSMERHDKSYEKYDNYEAYNVDKVSDIPFDSVNKILGVPITFIGSYCSEQFEIIGSTSDYENTSCFILKDYKNSGYRFVKSDGITPSNSGALRDKTSAKIPGKGNGDYSISPNGDFLNAVYDRIFIRRRQQEEES